MGQHSARADLDPIERASTDELRALQLSRMQWSLQHAYDNVAHYRLSFEAAGVHPTDLRRLEDLAGFPFLTKQDFRAQYPFGLFAASQRKHPGLRERHLLKGMVLVLEVKELARRGPVAEDSDRR